MTQEQARDGRSEKTTFYIVDAQSVKNTERAHENDYDAAKKISCGKHYLTVDTNGLPHAIHITTTNIGNRQSDLEMLIRH